MLATLATMLLALSAPPDGDPRCDPALRVARCDHPMLAHAADVTDPSDPLFRVNRGRAIPADYPVSARSTWRSCKHGRPPKGTDLVCLRGRYTNRNTALRRLAWDSPAPKSLERTHDGLEVGFRGRVGFKALIDAAREEAGFGLVVTSAYRPYAIQRAIFEEHVTEEMERGLTREEAVAKASTYSAVPGHSEHQLGTTADLTYTRANGSNSGFARILARSMRESRQWRWLRANAHRFGLVMTYRPDRVPLTQYVWEPWHWRFVGVGAADAMRACDLDLESFLAARSGVPAPPYAQMELLVDDEAIELTDPEPLPRVVRPGQPVRVRMAAMNTGSVAWAGYRLEPLTSWPGSGALAIDLPCTPPLSDFAANVLLRAPETPGRYEASYAVVAPSGGGPPGLFTVPIVVLSSPSDR